MLKGAGNGAIRRKKDQRSEGKGTQKTTPQSTNPLKNDNVNKDEDHELI